MSLECYSRRVLIYYILLNLKFFMSQPDRPERQRLGTLRTPRFLPLWNAATARQNTPVANEPTVPSYVHLFAGLTARTPRAAAEHLSRQEHRNRRETEHSHLEAARARMHQLRAGLSHEAAEQRRDRLRLRMQQLRGDISPEAAQEERDRLRFRMQQLRSDMSTEVAQQERDRLRLRMQQLRDDMSPEAVQHDQTTARARMRRVRARRTVRYLSTSSPSSDSNGSDGSDQEADDEVEPVSRMMNELPGSALNVLLEHFHYDVRFENASIQHNPHIAAMEDGRQQDLPAGQQVPQVPYEAHIQLAAKLHRTINELMPDRICGVCSRMCTARNAEYYTWSSIPNVDLLRADVHRTVAVPRPANVVHWCRKACLADGNPPPPPPPVVYSGFRKQRNQVKPLRTRVDGGRELEHGAQYLIPFIRINRLI